MDRIEALKQVLAEAGINEQEEWLYMERQYGPSTLLEVAVLFRAIQREMLGRERPEWLDQFARNVSARKPRKSKFDEAILSLAASNLDRAALVEVIRYFQAKVAYMFLNVHDGTRPADEGRDGLNFYLAYEDRSAFEGGERARTIARMNLLQDDLHCLFENFLANSGDDYS